MSNGFRKSRSSDSVGTSCVVPTNPTPPRPHPPHVSMRHTHTGAVDRCIRRMRDRMPLLSLLSANEANDESHARTSIF